MGGTLAIQIAKCMGAETVATTASPGEKTELCKTLGADVVVNYRDEKFEDLLNNYDFAFDTTGESHKMPRILKEGEQKKVVTINGIPTREACDDVPTLNPGKRMSFILWLMRNHGAEKAAQECGVDWSYLFLDPTGTDMAQLLSWVEKGQVKPVIDQVWPLEQAKEAALRNFSGRATGKCVVQIVPEQDA